MFTDLEVKKIEKLSNNDINSLKILLANEATKMLHGKEAALKAEKTAKKFSDLFNQLLQFGHYKYQDCSHYGWSLTCDEVILQIDLTHQVNTCMRPFIPNYDD